MAVICNSINHGGEGCERNTVDDGVEVHGMFQGKDVGITKSLKILSHVYLPSFASPAEFVFRDGV